MIKTNFWLLIQLICIIYCSSTVCFAYKAGFYSARKKPSAENSTLQQIINTIGTADRMVRCHEIDQIDIGIGTLSGADSLGRTGWNPVYFKRSQVERFFKSEIHKSLLVVEVENFNTNKAAKLESFFSKFGYKRLMIIATNNEGLILISDKVKEIYSKRKFLHKQKTKGQ